MAEIKQEKDISSNPKLGVFKQTQSIKCYFDATPANTQPLMVKQQDCNIHQRN